MDSRPSTRGRPADRWEFEVQNIPPNPRIKSGTLVGIADFNPRLYITGPLITNRLSFSESLAYDMDKQPVRGLAWPHNEIWTHDFNSFTDFHYVFSRPTIWRRSRRMFFPCAANSPTSTPWSR